MSEKVQDLETLFVLTRYKRSLPRLVGCQRTAKQVWVVRHCILQRQARALAIPRREVLLPEVIPTAGMLVGRHTLELLFEALAVFGGEFIDHFDVDLVLQDDGSCSGISQVYVLFTNAMAQHVMYLLSFGALYNLLAAGVLKGQVRLMGS